MLRSNRSSTGGWWDGTAEQAVVTVAVIMVMTQLLGAAHSFAGLYVIT
jgi:hypothetical protein